MHRVHVDGNLGDFRAGRFQARLDDVAKNKCAMITATIISTTRTMTRPQNFFNLIHNPNN